MKIVSARARWTGLLKKVQAIKLNAKMVTRGSFVTEEELALRSNVNEAIKKLEVLQAKLFGWTEAQNYMLMGKHYVRKEAGGDEIAELEGMAIKRVEAAATELRKEANRLSQLIIDHLSNRGALGAADAARRAMGMKR